MIEGIEKYFEFDRHKTNLKTEIIAGLSTFLALSYIFVVNPAILSEGGINKSAALFATVIVSAVATIVMGVWAKKPFALAPGLEMNSYVVYFLIIGMGVTWQAGLGAVFWSGILFLILTISKVREKVINAIPDSLKVGLSAAVGVFLIIIALRLSEVLIYEGTSIRSLGQIFSEKSMVLIIGFVVAVVLKRFRVRGFILISIILCTFICHYIGLYEVNTTQISLDKEMFSAFGVLDIRMIFDPKLLSAIIILFVVDFYGSIAKFIGLSQNTSILEDNGNMPNQKEALLIDGGATVVGSVAGTTSITIFVESGVGIGAGGRTGFTAVICGILMLLFIPLASVVNLVPVIATTGALLWVGIELMPKISQIQKLKIIELIAVVLMIIVTAVTFALDKAMLISFGFYIMSSLFTGKAKEVNPYLVGSTLLILLSVFLSVYG